MMETALRYILFAILVLLLVLTGHLTADAALAIMLARLGLSSLVWGGQKGDEKDGKTVENAKSSRSSGSYTRRVQCT